MLLPPDFLTPPTCHWQRGKVGNSPAWMLVYQGQPIWGVSLALFEERSAAEVCAFFRMAMRDIWHKIEREKPSVN